MKFDVFLSHNSKDKPIVEQIAHKLEAKGLKVWLDKWNLVPGDAWQEDLENALGESQTIAVFVGPHEISPWENEEMRSAIEERVMDKRRRVIPVLLPGAPDNNTLKLPRFLKRLTWVDLRSGLSDEDALYRLECGIKGISPGKSSLIPAPLPLGVGDAPPPIGDLPIGSYLPFSPNPLFTGRVEDLKKLAAALLHGSGPGTVITQAITGMGGLGKTQLAVELAYRYGQYFRGVHWLNLADPTALDAEIAHRGLQMALEDWPDDQPAQVALTLNTWKANGPRLLVLDNFEDVEQINIILPRLRHSNLRLLITSRRTDWPATVGLILRPLGLFTPEESLAFLRRALEKRKDKAEELATLATRLGHLPLALELASRYLNGHPRLSLDEYLNQAQEAFDHPSMRGWREDLPAPTQHDLDLQRTFALSWEALNDEVVQKLFQMAGYLAPNTPIPLGIFEKALEISSDACDEALNTLYGLGLLGHNENYQPTIHPLLAEYARGLAKEAHTLLELLVNTLETLSDEAIETGLPSRFVLLRPHMPILARHAESMQVKSAGAIWNNYGYHFWMIADYSSAQVAYERALKIDPDNAIFINNLGLVMQDLGDLEGAQDMYERALKIDDATSSPDHPYLTRFISNLGNVLRELGDLPAARAASERAVKIAEAAFGPNHPDVATSVTVMGLVLRDLGDLPAARTALERALKIDEAALGPDHADVATDISNLGVVLLDMGDLPAARTAFERALKIDETTFGPDHPTVGDRFNSLGWVMKDMGDLPAARTALERALKIDEAALGPDHPNVARDISNLGEVLRLQGDLPAARTALERALKIDETTFGPDHPYVASDINKLGRVLQGLGDVSAARTAFERALAIFERSLPASHANIKLVRENLDSLNQS